MGRQYVGSEVNSIGPEGIFLNAHGDPTPSDADRPAKEGAASGHFAAVEAEIRGLRAILEPIKSQCWLFLCVLSKQRWAVAMIRTGLFLRTIAGVVMLSASSGSLRAQADEAEVSTPSAEPMPIMPLELGPPLPPLPPPIAPHFAVTTAPGCWSRSSS